jgi:hypothetical protein
MARGKVRSSLALMLRSLLQPLLKSNLGILPIGVPPASAGSQDGEASDPHRPLSQIGKPLS